MLKRWGIITCIFLSLRAEEQTTHTIVVFIHGTVQSGTSILLDSERTWKDIFNGESLSEQILHAARKEKLSYKSDLMLDYGLIEIPAAVLTQHQVSEEEQQYAAYHIVRLFHRLQPDHLHTTYHYYTFGWSGLLSETERKRAAGELYTSLMHERTRLLKHTAKVTCELYGYSHGGQLILHLPTIRSQQKDKDFTIERVVLSGTPLYYNNARNILRGMFKQIINCYSLGDAVQICDIFSTPDRSCQRTFAALAMPLPSSYTSDISVIDLQLEAHTHKKFFGHGSFFILNRMAYPRAAPQRSLYRQLIMLLQPFPLVSIYPPLIHMLDKQRGYHHYRARLTGSEMGIGIALIDNKNRVTLTTTIAASLLEEERATIQNAYKNGSYLSEFRKAVHTLKHAIIRLCQNQLRKTRLMLHRKSVSTKETEATQSQGITPALEHSQ